MSIIVIIYSFLLFIIFFILYLLISILYKIHYSYELENGCKTKPLSLSHLPPTISTDTKYFRN
jgi:hypothetical protein